MFGNPRSGTERLELVLGYWDREAGWTTLVDFCLKLNIVVHKTHRRSDKQSSEADGRPEMQQEVSSKMEEVKQRDPPSVDIQTGQESEGGCPGRYTQIHME